LAHSGPFSKVSYSKFLLKLQKISTLEQLKEGVSIPIILHNSLGWQNTKFIRIPIFRSDVHVKDSSGNVVDFQVNPDRNGSFELFFKAQIPALGYSTYFVEVFNGVSAKVERKFPRKEVVSIENRFYKVIDFMKVILNTIVGLFYRNRTATYVDQEKFWNFHRFSTTVL
jgi:hypothetical protein